MCNVTLMSHSFLRRTNYLVLPFKAFIQRITRFLIVIINEVFLKLRPIWIFLRLLRSLEAGHVITQAEIYSLIGAINVCGIMG